MKQVNGSPQISWKLRQQNSDNEVNQTIKTTSFNPPSVIKLYLLFVYAFTCFGFLVKKKKKPPKHVKAYTNNKYNLITLGRVNEVVLIVLTSVTDQK
jgi:hypothetical protein